MLKRFVSVILCVAMCLCVVPLNVGAAETDVAVAAAYNGPYVTVGETTLPLADHMPGTYFTKNGGACSCHAYANCVNSGSDCNCMRYYPTGNASDCEIDLMATQCFGFSRLVFYKCFGFIDQASNSSLYHSVGSLSSGSVSASSVKTLLMKAAPGAHVRLSRGHSVSILSMDEDFITVYQANESGDNVAYSACVVSTKKYSWSAFATYASAGISYVNMPNNYPGSSEGNAPDPVVYEVGTYVLTDNLNLRVEPNTSCSIILTIPNTTVIEVTEIDGIWGKTEYNGNHGWVCLDYTAFVEGSGDDTNNDTNEDNNDTGNDTSTDTSGDANNSTDTETPPEDTETPSAENPFVLGEDGYLRAVAWDFEYGDLAAFYGESVVVTDSSGNDITEGIVKSGDIITLPDGTSATVCLAGDVSLDGSLDAFDYLLTKRSYFGTHRPESVAKQAADVGGDGSLDATDYIYIKRFYFTLKKEIFSNFVQNSK